MKLHDDHGSVQAAEKMTLKEALHVLRDGNLFWFKLHKSCKTVPIHE
jgi:hypothetical protein